MSYVINNTKNIVNELQVRGLQVVNEGFGRNAKAQTPYPQYVIYLSHPHIHDKQADLADKIEDAWPDFVIDGFQSITYCKGIKYAVECWCFVHLKKDDKNFTN